MTIISYSLRMGDGSVRVQNRPLCVLPAGFAAVHFFFAAVDLFLAD